MIFYSWTAFSGGACQCRRREAAPAGTTTAVAMGITDDRARAMRAGEEILASGAAIVVIIEAVRPGMAAESLTPCYVRAGVGWLGRRTPAGRVSWTRFFAEGDQDEPRRPGRMAP